MDRGRAPERDAAQLVAADPHGDRERRQAEQIGAIRHDLGVSAEVREQPGQELGGARVELDGGEHRAGGERAQDQAAARQRWIDACAEPGGEVKGNADRGGQGDGRERQPGQVAELAGDGGGTQPRLQDPVVDDEHDRGGERDRVERLAQRQGGGKGVIGAA